MRSSLNITKEYIDEHYWKNGESIHIMAKDLGTYPNKIRRTILSFYPSLRTKSEAQSISLKNGFSKHPTKGKERTEEEKASISSSVAENWKGISKKERTRRVKEARNRWNKIPKDKKKAMSIKAAEGVRRAAKEGSSLEKYLLDELKNSGYNMLFHVDAIEGTNKMHVDLLVPESRTAIEVDGPSHFFPIWGQESLENHQKWDKEKNIMLTKNGFNVIRVKLYVNTISLRVKREVLQKLLSHLNDLVDKSSKLIEIEVK